VTLKNQAWRVRNFDSSFEVTKGKTTLTWEEEKNPLLQKNLNGPSGQTATLRRREIHSGKGKKKGTYAQLKQNATGKTATLVYKETPYREK